MRAILRTGFGGPDVLVIREIPEPEPKAGRAVIQVKAFGLNHAELHMRKGEWAEIADVSGIECVGVVKSCPGAEFAPGTKVAALMGGLGRTINGSYAEYTRAPVTNVAAIESGLSWADLAAIPETYATAWTCLFRNLEIAAGQMLVIRGAHLVLRPGGPQYGGQRRGHIAIAIIALSDGAIDLHAGRRHRQAIVGRNERNRLAVDFDCHPRLPDGGAQTVARLRHVEQLHSCLDPVGEFDLLGFAAIEIDRAEQRLARFFRGGRCGQDRNHGKEREREMHGLAPYDISG